MNDDTIQDLINALRRNLLYQTPELLFDEGAEEPRAACVKILAQDYLAIMQVIQDAGGWDLEPEQKAEVVRRQTTELVQAATSGQIKLEDLNAGALMQIVEMTEEQLRHEVVIPEIGEAWRRLNDRARQELMARGGAH